MSSGPSGFGGSGGSGGLGESAWVGGFCWCGVPGYFLFIQSNPKVYSNGNIVFDDSKEFVDSQVFDGLKVISNESMDFDDPKEFNS